MAKKPKLILEYSGLITKVDLSYGSGDPVCTFSIADKESGQTVPLYLQPTTTPDVNSRFYGMALIVLAAFESQCQAQVSVTTDRPNQDGINLAYGVGISGTSLATDDPVLMAFIGQVPELISIDGLDTAGSAECEISFSPDRPGRSRTWTVDGPFSHTVPSLIAAVVSGGRVALQARDPTASGTPLADVETVSIWTNKIASPSANKRKSKRH
jgi:hypothetical protein